jgi:hypothetical protein
MSKKNLDFTSDVQELTEQATAFQDVFQRLSGKEKTKPARAVQKAGEKPALDRPANDSESTGANGDASLAESNQRNNVNPIRLERTARKAAPTSVEQEVVVPLSTRITKTLLDRLEGSYLERRRKRLTPWKKQEIVMAALQEWLEQNGH